MEKKGVKIKKPQIHGIKILHLSPPLLSFSFFVAIFKVEILFISLYFNKESLE